MGADPEMEYRQDSCGIGSVLTEKKGNVSLESGECMLVADWVFEWQDSFVCLGNMNEQTESHMVTIKVLAFEQAYAVEPLLAVHFVSNEYSAAT